MKGKGKGKRAKNKGKNKQGPDSQQKDKTEETQDFVVTDVHNKSRREFWKRVIDTLVDHRSNPEVENAAHSLMCGSSPLPFVIGKKSGKPVNLPCMYCFDTPEKRKVLYGLVAEIYARNPRETLPLVEFGARVNKNGLFTYSEDIDILLKAEQVKGYAKLLTDVSLTPEVLAKAARQDEMSSAQVLKVLREIEGLILRRMLPSRIRSLGRLWDEDTDNVCKANTELLVFSSSGYALRYCKWKISLHLVWPELRVDEEMSIQIRERLLSDLKRSRDPDVSWFERNFFSEQTQEEFDDVFDQSCVRGASLRMVYCDKFTRKDIDGKECYRVEGRPKVPIFHCKVDFLAHGCQTDQQSSEDIAKFTPAKDAFKPIEWLERSQVAFLTGKDADPQRLSNILQNRSVLEATARWNSPRRALARTRTQQGSRGGQKKPVRAHSFSGTTQLKQRASSSTSRHIVGASSASRFPHGENVFDPKTSSRTSPGSAHPLEFDHMLCEQDILSVWKVYLPPPGAANKDIVAQYGGIKNVHHGFVLHVDGARDAFLGKMAVGVVLRFGHYAYVGDSDLQFLPGSSHTLFQGGFLFKGEDLEGDHEAAAASVGFFVLQSYLEQLKTALRYELGEEDATSNKKNKGKGKKGKKNSKAQARKANRLYHAGSTADELVRGSEICLAADSRVPIYALENKAKKLAAKQVQLLQSQRAALERDFIDEAATQEAQRIQLRWVRRENNKDADRFAKNALSEKHVSALPDHVQKQIMESLR
ncbi:unnamed protein product [Amoebophrya sp. A25]|nr:unnamed protein product [Amoebophrya sp. A25]|eukprot:GSA25T00011973001.1